MKIVFAFFILMGSIVYAGKSYGDRVYVDYGNGNGFNGIIQDIRGDRLRVKVTDLQLNGFFTFFLKATYCSGNEELHQGDRKLIWIPKSCID